jgi:hypothetical protein
VDWGVRDAQKRGTDPDTLASFPITVRDGLAIQPALDPTRVPNSEQLPPSHTAALTPERTAMRSQ